MSARLEIRIDSDNAAFDASVAAAKAELCRILDVNGNKVGHYQLGIQIEVTP